MTDSNPNPTAWYVTRIEEDAFAVKVTLGRVSWSRPLNDDNDCDEWEDAAPGEPGAGWVPEGISTVLTFDRDEAHTFDIGRHYVLALTEVQDASVMAI